MLLNEDGAVFKTATEWLQWRDQMAFLMATRPDLHAEVMGPFTRGIRFQDRVNLVAAMADVIHRSEVVIWERDKWQAATNGSETWTGVQAPDVPPGMPSQIWTFPTDTYATEEEKRVLELEDGYDLTAILLHPVERADAERVGRWYRETGLDPGDWMGQPGWTLTLIYALDQKKMAQLSLRDVAENPLPLAYRLRSFAALDAGKPIPSLYSQFFAGYQFMNMEFIELEKVETTRQQRRQYERRYPDRSSTVQIVTLRRVKHEKDGGEAREVERHCQWLVRGHWRRRNERWKSSDAPIWVRPHVKGPDGMPMKPVLDRIINVRR